MAQSKLNDLAGRFSKGPKGLGTGLKLLALAGAAGYGVSQSMYTGKCYISGIYLLIFNLIFCCCNIVEGGHRAIIFSRLGGVKNETYTEGLHLRLPWFQYPIIYDIRFALCFALFLET